MKVKATGERQHCPLFRRAEMQLRRTRALGDMRAHGHLPRTFWTAIDGDSFVAQGYTTCCVRCGATLTVLAPGAYLDGDGKPQVRDWGQVQARGAAVTVPCPV